MPHRDQSHFITAPLNVQVWPITGNIANGGACYDPSSGKALYATLDGDGTNVGGGGVFKCYRTKRSYDTLATTNNSVEYVATIADGQWYFPTNAWLQRINGSLYAHISGKDKASLFAGDYIYRDTSAAQNGSGPWVHHGTVWEVDMRTWQDSHFSDTGNGGGEILVLGDLWVVNANYFRLFFGGNYGYTEATAGVATSFDGGRSWTKRLDVGWYIGGRYGHRWARNFAYWDGYWYVGGSGNVHHGKHFKSADGINWQDLGTLGSGNGGGTCFPFSTSEKIYRWDGNYGTTWLQSTPHRPEDTVPPGTPEGIGEMYQDPLWINEVRVDPPLNTSQHIPIRPQTMGYPQVCDIGPESDPLWIATIFGHVAWLGAPIPTITGTTLESGRIFEPAAEGQ